MVTTTCQGLQQERVFPEYWRLGNESGDIYDIQHTFYHVQGKAWRLKMQSPLPPRIKPPKRSCAQMQSVFCSAYLQPANIARAPIIMWRILSGMDNAFLLVGLQGWALASICFCKPISSDGFETLIRYRKSDSFLIRWSHKCITIVC
jgi:hypothetical protein